MRLTDLIYAMVQARCKVITMIQPIQHQNRVDWNLIKLQSKQIKYPYSP